MKIPYIHTDKQLHPIIPFNLIMDTDVGLIRYIAKEYSNNAIWDEFALKMSMVELIKDIQQRGCRNPLFICIKHPEENKESMKALYKDFMNKKYEDIISNSITTELFNAVSLFCDADSGIFPTILCTELEASYLKKHEDFQYIEKSNILISESGYKGLDVSEYDPIFVKDVKDTLYMKNLEGKNVYIASYGFNVYIDEESDQLIPNPKVAGLISDKNQIKIVDIYSAES